MASRPTGRKRNRKQKVKARYSKSREEAQLAGVLPTTPEGAVRSERVDPASQGEQSIPALDRAAIRNGWEVPDAVKAKVIERLAEPFFFEPVVVVRSTDDRGDVVKRVEVDRYLLKENAKVLLLADQRQYERDHPEEAGKARGTTNNTTNNTQVNQVNVVMRDLDDVLRKIDRQLGVARGGSEASERTGPETPPGGQGTDVAPGEVVPAAAGDSGERGDVPGDLRRGWEQAR